MQSDFDNDLQSYFTDMDPLRGMFKDFVSAEKLPKRLIVLHGVGGVGKSSLLRMFRLHCKSEKIPVALASGDDAKSVLDVITRWMEDLKEDGVKFSSLYKTLESYRAIQAKVEDQARKSQNKVADIAGKAASKTAEAAGGALLGAAIGSIVPGVGTAIGGMVGSAVGGMGVEALTDWLRGFLDKSSIDLLLDPAKKLTSDFLEDLAKAAEKKRIVLLLNTYEQMSALEDWVGEVAQKIHPNGLMVIAGRKLPDWNRVWSGWMMNAQVEELKPMTEDIMRQLIRRYYATMRGGEPDPAQVEAIIKFARGLPMVVTSAVQLWVKYGVEDFQSVKAEIVANLVDRLMEGVPSNLIPALEAAAVVRWFDQPILRAVMKQEDVRDVYNELRRFPFVRSRSEGLTLHDSVREMMDENLRVQDSERHVELHERAAVYFEKRLEKVAGEEAERLGLERLYHRVRADEEIGTKLFQEIAEEMVRYRLLSKLQTLLTDINTYGLRSENNRSWVTFNHARLLHFQARTKEAEELYRTLTENENVEPKLRAYSLCNLGRILSRWERLGGRGMPDYVIQILEQSLSLVPLDLNLTDSLLCSARVLEYVGDWDRASSLIDKAAEYFETHVDNYGLLHTLDDKRRHCYLRGDWKQMLAVRRAGQTLLSQEPDHLSFRATVFGNWALGFVYAGRCYETELDLRESILIHKQLGDTNLIINHLRFLGLTLGLQGKYDEGLNLLIESIELSTNLGTDYRLGLASAKGYLGKMLARQGKLNLAEQAALQCLAIKREFNDNIELVWVLDALAEIKEILGSHDQAEEHFRESLRLRKVGRHYFESTALTGLVRVKYAQGDIAAIRPLLVEAEQLAQQYEYNDHLASLRLTQGHLAWENGNQDETLGFYQHAIIYALRYNRFLLDELLSGRPQGTPLRPIIPYCLEHGEEGKKILLVLRDWWKTGVNDIGTPRPDTISPIPEGISLLEAEKIAREREPGDGAVQNSVVEQLGAVL